MSLEVIQVPPSAVEAAEGVIIGIPALAYLGVDNGVVVGSCGLAWSDGRCWIWLEIYEPKPAYGITVFRKTAELLRKAWQLGETAVYTPRDVKFATSEKLLTKLGFRFHGIEQGIEVWRNERV